MISEELIIAVKAQTDKAVSDLKSVEAQTQAIINTGKQLSTFVTLPLLALGTAFVMTAADAEETNSKFDAVFKNQSTGVRAWAKEFSAATNRATIDNIGFLSTIQDTLVPLGFMRDEAAELSKTTVTLATDLASFNNLPTEDVIKSIQSALVGNHETVRKFGVVLNVAAIEQELLNMGLTDGFDAASEEEKALARLNIIIDSTADAQGDAVATAESFTNQMVGMESAGTAAAEAFGTLLLPALSDIIGYITDALKWFTELDDGMKGIILTLAGIAAAAGPVVMGIGAIQGAIAVFSVTAAAVFGPIGLIIAGVAGLIALGNAIDEVIGPQAQHREAVEKMKAPLKDIIELTAQRFEALQDLKNSLIELTDVELAETKAQTQLQLAQVQTANIDDFVKKMLISGMEKTLVVIANLQDERKKLIDGMGDEGDAAGDLGKTYDEQLKLRVKQNALLVELFGTEEEKFIASIEAQAAKHEELLLDRFDKEKWIADEIAKYRFEKAQETAAAAAELEQEELEREADFLAEKAALEEEAAAAEKALREQEQAELKKDLEDRITEYEKYTNLVMAAVGNLFDTMATQLVEGEASWESFAKVAQGAIANVIRALANEMIVNAAGELAKFIASFGLNAAAGAAAAAYTAGAALGYGTAALVESFAQGGSFETSGPQMIMVGDNPGGVEKVDITPVSGPGGDSGSSRLVINISLDGIKEKIFDEMYDASNKGDFLISAGAII